MKMKVFLAATCVLASTAASAAGLPAPRLLAALSPAHVNAAVPAVAAMPSLGALPRVGMNAPALKALPGLSASNAALPGLDAPSLASGAQYKTVCVSSSSCYDVDTKYGQTLGTWRKTDLAYTVSQNNYTLRASLHDAQNHIKYPCGEGCGGATPIPVVNKTLAIVGALPTVLADVANGALGLKAPSPPPSPVMPHSF